MIVTWDGYVEIMWKCIYFERPNLEILMLLRSVVGKTHVLRKGLVMDYTTSYFPLIVLGYPLDSKRSDGP